MFLYLLSSLVHANDFNGKYILSDSPESLVQQKKIALGRTLEAMNPLFRYPASKRLSTKPPECKNYQITNIENGVSVQCDSKKALEIREETSHHTTKTGEQLTVASSIKTNQIQFVLIGEAGKMSTQMILSGERLTVTKTVESPALPVPLIMTYTYQRNIE